MFVELNLDPFITWIASCLSGISQRVAVDGEASEPVRVLSSVPQGSVLGPLIVLYTCIH